MHRACNKWRKPKGSKNRKKAERCRKKIKDYWERQKNKDITDKNSAESAEKIEQPVSTSVKKLSFFEKIEEKSNEDHYILVHTSVFSNLMPDCYCKCCENVTSVTVNTNNKKGLAVLLQVICDTCGEIIKETYSSEQISEKKNSGFDVNKRLVDSFLQIGAGHATLIDFCAYMKLDCISNSTYYNHLKRIKEDAQELKKSVLQKSREVAKTVHNSLPMDSVECQESSEVIEILCSFDGSWQKRGHTSLYGLGCAIDVLTGLVVDYEVLSKYCHLCTRAAADLDIDSPEYHFWYEGHVESSECCKNFSGPSGSMEVKCAEILWQRSEKMIGK